MDGFQHWAQFQIDPITWWIFLASRCSNRSVGWAQMAQSCQVANSGVEAEKPECPPLSRKKMLKESALHHRIYCVCPLCSQHSEIWENDVQSGSLVTLNRLFRWGEIWGCSRDQRGRRASRSFEKLQEMILEWFYDDFKNFQKSWLSSKMTSFWTKRPS